MPQYEPGRSTPGLRRRSTAPETRARPRRRPRRRTIRLVQITGSHQEGHHAVQPPHLTHRRPVRRRLRAPRRHAQRHGRRTSPPRPRRATTRRSARTRRRSTRSTPPPRRARYYASFRHSEPLTPPRTQSGETGWVLPLIGLAIVAADRRRRDRRGPSARRPPARLARVDLCLASRRDSARASERCFTQGRPPSRPPFASSDDPPSAVRSPLGNIRGNIQIVHCVHSVQIRVRSGRRRTHQDGSDTRVTRLRAWSTLSGWRFESSSAHSESPAQRAVPAPAGQRAERWLRAAATLMARSSCSRRRLSARALASRAYERRHESQPAGARTRRVRRLRSAARRSPASAVAVSHAGPCGSVAYPRGRRVQT